jgi:7-cyano-7-deazaguanine synthase in queuosine biosynthesis
MKDIETLIHFSGGQDSTYALWDWLRKNPDKRCLVHHVHLQNPMETRDKEESRAVKKILRWLRDKGMKNYVYYDSGFQYGSLPGFVKDIQVVAMFTAIILRSREFTNVKEVMLSWHKGEVDADHIRRGFRVRAILDACEVPRKRYELVFPIEHLTRAEMAAEMPPELLALCSSCRKPIAGRNCGRCATCQELRDAGLIYRVNPKL